VSATQIHRVVTPNLHDFAEAAHESSRRTRTLLVVLVVACVLALVGFLNSLESGWMLQCVRAASDPAGQYVGQKLDFPSELNPQARDALQGAIIRAYIDNAMTVRVPFFGVAFDVNDLGLLGGLGFVTILMLLRFSLRTEIASLRIAFKAAAREAEGDPLRLEAFYDLLAMQQVLTMPRMRDPRTGWAVGRPRLLRAVPKLICFLPVVVYTMVALNDYRSQHVANVIDQPHTRILLAYTGVLWIVIVLLAAWCFARLLRIDRIWDEYFAFVSGQSPGTGPPASG
jgi:hypothetical protein